MGFLDPYIHKLRDGKYRARFVCQDLDETSGTLADLKLWVEGLIEHHGEAADLRSSILKRMEVGQATVSSAMLPTKRSRPGSKRRLTHSRKLSSASERSTRSCELSSRATEVVQSELPPPHLRRSLRRDKSRLRRWTTSRIFRQATRRDHRRPAHMVP